MYGGWNSPQLSPSSKVQAGPWCLLAWLLEHCLHRVPPRRLLRSWSMGLPSPFHWQGADASGHQQWPGQVWGQTQHRGVPTPESPKRPGIAESHLRTPLPPGPSQSLPTRVAHSPTPKGNLDLHSPHQLHQRGESHSSHSHRVLQKKMCLHYTLGN